MPSHPHLPGCARLNVGRLNAFRLNYYEPLSFATIGGVDRSRNVRIEGAAVEHALNDQPDTASVRVHGFTPVAGQPFALYHGDRSPELQLFGGRILETTAVYESVPRNVAWDLRAIDPTWLLNRRRVLDRYGDISATVVIRLLIPKYTRGITMDHVAPNLPVIDQITFTNETVASCLTAICERIGANWYLDYDDDLHVFLNEGPDAAPITDADCRTSADHTLAEDLSQVVTRVIGRGAGVGAAVDLEAGATEIPVDLGDAPNIYDYSPTGGLAEVGANRITYAEVRGLAGWGALVGKGHAPTVAPAPVLTTGTSHVLGATYKYAATFTTAAGETTPGPVGFITITSTVFLAPPVVTARSRGAGAYPPGMISPAGPPIRFLVQIAYVGGAWGPVGAATAPYTWDGNDWEVYIGSAVLIEGGYYYPVLEPAGPTTSVSGVYVYRSDNGMPFGYASGESPVGGWIRQCCSGYSSGGPQPPTAGGMRSVLVQSVPVSSHESVTGRKLYRNVANGGDLKLLTTIANNTTTSFIDTVADAALGVLPPMQDTAGIKDDEQVLAGATALPVSSLVPFTTDAVDSRGWVRIGHMVVRYTGLGTNKLTGIPAAGIGSLTATVQHGAQVLLQPRLIGVTGVTYPIRKGETVTIRIEVEDVPAQFALAVRLGGPAADGIVEEPFSDSRMGYVELQDYAEALLSDRKDPRLTLTFTTRDPSVAIGRLITVTLTQPPISGTFRIQRISFSEIAITGGLARVAPLRTVTASNKLYTFTDLMRRLRGREGGAG